MTKFSISSRKCLFCDFRSRESDLILCENCTASASLDLQAEAKVFKHYINKKQTDGKALSAFLLENNWSIDILAKLIRISGLKKFYESAFTLGESDWIHYFSMLHQADSQLVKRRIESLIDDQRNCEGNETFWEALAQSKVKAVIGESSHRLAERFKDLKDFLNFRFDVKRQFESLACEIKKNDNSKVQELIHSLHSNVSISRRFDEFRAEFKIQTGTSMTQVLSGLEFAKKFEYEDKNRFVGSFPSIQELFEKHSKSNDIFSHELKQACHFLSKIANQADLTPYLAQLPAQKKLVEEAELILTGSNRIEYLLGKSYGASFIDYCKAAGIEIETLCYMFRWAYVWHYGPSESESYFINLLLQPSRHAIVLEVFGKPSYTLRSFVRVQVEKDQVRKEEVRRTGEYLAKTGMNRTAISTNWEPAQIDNRPRGFVQRGRKNPWQK